MCAEFAAGRVLQGGRDEVPRLLGKFDIDVVLLGLHSLKWQGIGLLKVIRDIRPAVQVLILNQPGQVGLAIEAMKQGAVDEVLLPLELNALVSRIMAACRRKRAVEASGKSLLNYCRDMMVAASFAEANAPETALEFLPGIRLRGRDKKGKERP